MSDTTNIIDTMSLGIEITLQENELMDKDTETDRFREVVLTKVVKNRLNASLCVPSSVQAYSMCIEYVRKWFLGKFSDDYFKTIYIEGQHSLTDFRKYDKTSSIKRKKPALSIIPQVDYSFDTDELDSTVYCLDMYMNRSNKVDSFFKDFDKKLFLAVLMEVTLINFTFKIKVNTKAKQLDLFHFIKTAFGSGTTQGHYVDMDYHVPTELLAQLAMDTGYEINTDGVVLDAIGFLSYLNKNSKLPFLYKFRCINGNNEYFIRVPNLYVYHHKLEISVNDAGDRQGMISSNYEIECTTAIRFPAPRFFRYYSTMQHDNISFANTDGDIVSYISNFNYVPLTNSRGWNQFATTELHDGDTDKPLVIDFSELFSQGSNDLIDVINYTKSIRIDPSIFIDIKIYNDRVERAYTMDWDTMKATSAQSFTQPITLISIYLETEYFNEQLAYIRGFNNNRLSEDYSKTKTLSDDDIN